MRRPALLAVLVVPLALGLAGCSLPFGGSTGGDDPDCCTPTIIDTETLPPADTGDFTDTGSSTDTGSIDAAGAPARMTLVVGGFIGPSDSYVWDGSTLVHVRAENSGDANPDIVQGTPPAEAWTAFRQELDALDAWSWESTYFNVDVQDGTQWTLQLEWDGRTIESSGSNAFPGSEGPEYGEQFERFLAAVDALAASIEAT